LQEIKLLPYGALLLNYSHKEKHPPAQKKLIESFACDWRAGWFFLAANKHTIECDLSLRFWQEISSCFLSVICHLPSDQKVCAIPPPTDEYLSEQILRAPPMIGGEYLSVDMLLSLWHSLSLWFGIKLIECKDIDNFLNTWAPRWQQVGRVCFHLAENKKNSEAPFAFLATFTTGLSQEGRLRHLPLKEALTRYSGANNRKVLLKLLTPIYKAKERCDWVKAIVSSSEIYSPLAWSTAKAYKFLLSVPELEQSGLSVTIPNWWKRRTRPKVSLTLDSSSSKFGASSLLDFDLQVVLGDHNLSPQELSNLLNSKEKLICLRGEWVEVNAEKLQTALDHWKQIEDRCKKGGISFIEGMRLLAGAPPDLIGEHQDEDLNEWVSVKAGKELAKTLKNLRDPSQMLLKKFESPTLKLRSYQQEGLNWLYLLTGLGLGACLADDMGLGKTVQILSLLELIKKKKSNKNQMQNSPLPSLLVVPASLLSNWKSEACKFTPSLNLFFLHPSECKDLTLNTIAADPLKYLSEADLIVTTYSMTIRLKWLKELSWNLLILDEAQAIKNPGAKQTKAIKSLKSNSPIVLTGTPIENHLSDLWSLFDFLNPGLLGSFDRFKNYITSLQETNNQFAPLRKLISPYILRRMKNDPKIISDLPAKTEVSALCTLTKEQAKQYQQVVENLKSSLEENSDSKNRRGVVLRALLHLKQICNHPCQYRGTGEYSPSHSGKFQRLAEICKELAIRQEKVLIFTQYREIIAPLEEFLSSIFQRRGLALHGGTAVKKRKSLVDEFQKDNGPPFFILSLKAGGTGLTLTAASHVIHFDRWWNPAVENQATDRAFRIGQKKNVLVHKFITIGTVEEKIDETISYKKKLADDVIASKHEIKITELSDKQLLEMLSLDLERATTN